MIRYLIVFYAAVTLPLCLLGSQTAANEKQASRPNVLFLFTDDQRADTISALGNGEIHTPVLDQLVQRGFVFENAYCMGSTMPAVCRPSRHMVHSGMSLFRYNPKPGPLTPGIARTFKAAGYETYHHSKRGNTARKYHEHYEHSHYLNDQKERTSGHHGRTAAEDAIKFLNQRKTDRPFMMYLGFAGPHDPRVAAEQWLDGYEIGAIPLPANYLPFHPFDNGELLIRDEKLAPWPRTKQIVKQNLRDYYACITSIDFQIGRILTTLKQLNQLDNTIILFSSDHGLAIGSHGLMGKQSVYEHSMKSPLFVAGPGISPGKTAALMYLMDIYPTLVDLAGIAIPKGLDGVSQKPVIDGQVASIRSEIFLAYKNSQRAVRIGDWKLIRYPLIDYQQLFNLKQDPDEMHNLADDPRHADKLLQLTAKLSALQVDLNDPHPLVVESPVDGKNVELDYFRSAQPQ